mmetsp:Transcript_17794/g.60078  ORF Transcript_17794/g.60078 Transcript_17794/m.60078 type:complete len:252 (-) Transcript_17794:2947-3702(-)
MTMFTTQLQRPAAAEFLDMMISGWKCSISRYMRTSFQLTTGTLPASKTSLYDFKSSTNFFGSPSMNFFEESQDRSLSLTLPFFWMGMVAVTPASSTMHAEKTSSTPGGGLVIVLHICSALTSKVSSAAMAASTAGTAFARSASADICLAPTSPAIFVTFFSSMAAFSDSISTTSFSALTRLAMPSATFFFWLASCTSTAMADFNTSTTEVQSSSFCTPFLRRAVATSFSSRFEARILEKSFKSSRYDFGVV